MMPPPDPATTSLLCLAPLGHLTPEKQLLDAIAARPKIVV